MSVSAQGQTLLLTDEEAEQASSLDYPGLSEVCHQGCAIYSYLGVNGPTHGTIWEGRENLCPTALTFCMWYRRWLDRALQALNNERRLFPRLLLGMTSAEVVAEAGGDWKVRPYPSDEGLRFSRQTTSPLSWCLTGRSRHGQTVAV